MRVIRRARPDEAEPISRLALASKGHWAYSDAELEIFRGELTLSPGHLEHPRPADPHVHVPVVTEPVT